MGDLQTGGRKHLQLINNVAYNNKSYTAVRREDRICGEKCHCYEPASRQVTKERRRINLGLVSAEIIHVSG